MKRCIIVPARYGSTRLPGKPLAKISGQTMLSRVVKIAQAASKEKTDVDVVVATDDERIMNHCEQIGVKAVMTPMSCPTGTDRALAAVEQLNEEYDFVVNLQGDAPMTPPHFVKALLDAFEADPSLNMVTTVVQLSWEALDDLREHKKVAPFSGTCAIVCDGHALWFSKSIIPAIRKENDLRKEGEYSPVHQHIGLYGYSVEFLKKYVTWSQSSYEKLEGLEQLRILENDYKVRAVKVSYGDRPASSGVDSPEDIARTEALIAKHGELSL